MEEKPLESSCLNKIDSGYQEAKENLKVLEKSRDNLIEAISQVGANEAIGAKISEYEQQIGKVRQFIESTERLAQSTAITAEDVKRKIAEFRAYMLKPGNITRTKSFLAQYIQRVEISNERVKAIFKVALPVQKEDAELPTFTHEEGITRTALLRDYSDGESNRIIENLYFPSPCVTSDPR